jgi:hypothetical protein
MQSQPFYHAIYYSKRRNVNSHRGAFDVEDSQDDTDEKCEFLIMER